MPATLSFNPFTIYPHTNWRGDYQTGTWTTRETQRCARVPQNTEDYETEPDTPLNPGGITVVSSWMHCLAAVKWPAKYIWLDHSTRAQPPGSDELWIGSLVYNKRDLTGNVYMRNRYYDATAGRFSQEDPIGLAGGLNAYGFAAGDPVSYSDPYGLCPYCVALVAAGIGEQAVPGIGQVVGTATLIVAGVAFVAWQVSSTEPLSTEPETRRDQAVYHRTAGPVEIQQVVESGEVWGAPMRNIFSSDIPKVKAVKGPLPAGVRGYEFVTHVPPDPTAPALPWATWNGQRPDVETTEDGSFAKIPVTVTKVQP